MTKKYVIQTIYADGEIEFCYCSRFETRSENIRLKNLGVKFKRKIYRNVSKEILKKL